MIITKTPLRISFLGGGTDYPAWFKEHGGAVLSTTIDKYTYISVRWLPPFFEHKHRVVWSQIENVNRIEEIHHPGVRECLRYMGIQDGIVINHDGDLPALSGMGTSSAFTVGLLTALHHLKNEGLSSVRIAEEAIHVEQELIREHVGNQDQVAASIGGLNLIEFPQDGRFTYHSLPISEQRKKELEQRLMLVFTGLARRASDVAGTYQFTDLHELCKMAYAGKSLLEHGNLTDFGKLLNESWKIKKTLSPQVSTPYIDYLYERAMKAGAIGGKLLGAGTGGFLLLFCEPDLQPEVEKVLKGLLFVPFRFENKGTQVIANGG